MTRSFTRKTKSFRKKRRSTKKRGGCVFRLKYKTLKSIHDGKGSTEEKKRLLTAEINKWSTCNSGRWTFAQIIDKINEKINKDSTNGAPNRPLIKEVINKYNVQSQDKSDVCNEFLTYEMLKDKLSEIKRTPKKEQHKPRMEEYMNTWKDCKTFYEMMVQIHADADADTVKTNILLKETIKKYLKQAASTRGVDSTNQDDDDASGRTSIETSSSESRPSPKNRTRKLDLRHEIPAGLDGSAEAKQLEDMFKEAKKGTPREPHLFDAALIDSDRID